MVVQNNLTNKSRNELLKLAQNLGAKTSNTNRNRNLRIKIRLHRMALKRKTSQQIRINNMSREQLNVIAHNLKIPISKVSGLTTNQYRTYISEYKKKKEFNAEMNSLRNKARQLGLRVKNNETMKLLKFRIKLAQKKTTHNKGIRKLNTNEMSFVLKRLNKQVSSKLIEKHLDKLGNLVNIMTYNNMTLNSNFTNYFLIIHENSGTLINKNDLVKLINHPDNIFYKVTENSQGKTINFGKVYIRLSIPFNMMIEYNQLIELFDFAFQSSVLTIFELLPTQTNLGELISSNVVNRGGTIVGSHHGGDKLYKIKIRHDYT